MKIVYLGTPDFSVLPLKNLIDNGFNVVAVVCNNDKPVGRKHILTPPPVKVFALERGIKVFQYDKIRLEGVEDIKSLNPDLLITCAFGQILSQDILDIPKYGVINIHASLLPKYRGASPINYAILNGEKKTGVTIMKTDIGIDTGDIILQKEIEILDNDNAGDLFNKLSVLGSNLIIDAVKLIESGKVSFIKQDEKLATFTKMIKKEDALIDFSLNAEKVKNIVRAYNPAPVAYTFLNGEQLKIFEVEVVDYNGKVGEVLKNENQLIVGCGVKAISILRLQKAGGVALNIKDFLRGNKINIGEILG